MAFKKIDTTGYPPRHWSLVGYPGSGKSTFADYRIFTETGDGQCKT